MREAGFGNLGFYNLSILYLTVSISSFFSTPIVNKMGIRISLFVGTMCYVFWTISFLCPSMYNEKKGSGVFLFNHDFIVFLLLFSSAANGFGASILWVA